MAYTLAQVKNEVLQLLQKDSTYQGFYTDSKIFSAVNDSFLFLAGKMSLQGQGWLKQTAYITTMVGVSSYTLPANISTIRSIRYLTGTTYIPLEYRDTLGDAFTTISSPSQYPDSYTISGNQIVFNPAPGTVGTNFIQIETVGYPAILSSLADEVGAQFDESSVRFVVYRAASVLVAALGEAPPAWKEYEAQWYGLCESLIARRNSGPRFVREWYE